MTMTQTRGRLFDGMAQLMTDAVGVAEGVKREVDTVVRSQAEKILGDLDLVRREEFDAVRDMAAKARAENEALAARLAALETRLAALEGSPPESLSDDRPSDV
jgi:BMFP domain-containing protein YqiC